MPNTIPSDCCFRILRVDGDGMTHSKVNSTGSSPQTKAVTLTDLKDLNIRDQWSMLMANRTCQILNQKGGNLHLIQLNPNLFTIIPVLDPESVSRKEQNRRAMFNTRKTVYRHTTTKHRHRKNFDQNVKKRILDLYLKMINEDPSYSIRNVALAIFNIMSKEE